MNDLPLTVDLDHGPVGVHADDLAAADAPEQARTLQVIQRAPWMTCEQTLGVPAEASGALGPVPAQEVADIAQEKTPAMRWYSGMRW
jgi:hypothetical protein